LRSLPTPKLVTTGYGDRDGYDRTDPALRDAAHAHDAALRAREVEMGVAGTPVQVRNTEAPRNGQRAVHELVPPVAGFAIIEARGLAEAVELVSKTPCAVAHGVVEVWPSATPSRSRPTRMRTERTRWKVR
jgi:hypothetical protein